MSKRVGEQVEREGEREAEASRQTSPRKGKVKAWQVRSREDDITAAAEL